MNNSFKITIAAIFILCYTIIGFRATKVSIYHETRARNGILGDGFSDINVVSSAKYFLDSGFTQTKWLPVHDYYPESANTPQVYTHYPALPNILAGMYAKLFNSVNEPLLRLIPVLLSVCFFFFIYFVLNQLLQQQTIALIGSSLLWLGCYFLNFADNLHQHLYGEFLKWIYFYALYVYHRNGSNSLPYVFLLFLLMLVQVNISFEQPVFLGILTVGFSIIYQKSLFTKTTMLGATGVVVGFMLHLWQNALYFGGWQLAIDDFIKAYTFRATGAEVEGYVKEAPFGLADIWQIPFGWFNRMERYYVLPGWAILVMCFWGIKWLKQYKPELYKISWALFAASIAWSLFMPQHAFIHAFTNKHFSIWVGLMGGVSVYAYYKQLQIDFATKENIALKSFHVVLITYCIAMFGSQQVYEVWLKFALLYPALGY